MNVGVLEAKNRLSELLDRVERGEEIVITRHGRPAGRLIGPGPRAKTPGEVAEIMESARRFRESLPRRIALEEIISAIHEGRKY